MGRRTVEYDAEAIADVLGYEWHPGMADAHQPPEPAPRERAPWLWRLVLAVAR